MDESIIRALSLNGPVMKAAEKSVREAMAMAARQASAGGTPASVSGETAMYSSLEVLNAVRGEFGLPPA